MGPIDKPLCEAQNESKPSRVKMKWFFVSLLVFTVVAGAAMAQDSTGAAQGQMVLEKAKRLRDANNAQQQSMMNSEAIPATQSTAAPHGIDPLQAQLIDKLRSDLTAAAAAPSASSVQKQAIQDDLLNLAKGAVKPSADSLGRVADGITTAISGGKLKNPAQLARSLNVVVNAGNLAATQVQPFVAAAQSGLKSSGVADAAAQGIADDLKAIASELQKGRSKP
jgi:hypothetical protein